MTHFHRNPGKALDASVLRPAAARGGGPLPLLSRLARAAASLRLTTAGFVVLALVALAAQADTRVPAWALVLPQVLLALNLAASMATQSRIRRGGLGLFHAALLGCLLLLAWGRLTHYEGRVEVTQGSAFDVDAAEPLSVGPWHGERLRRVRFDQGPVEVRYAPGLKRSRTLSQVTVSDGDGATATAATRAETVGDDHPLRVAGFRFYTTHNKGFAPLLAWTPPGGPTLTGAVHLPSYPLFDGQQQQRWTPPGGPELRLWLRLPQPVDERAAWQLQPEQVRAVLVAEVEGQRFELRPGDTAAGAFGALRYERLLGWMGYRIHFDPTLTALWWLACAGLAGLALHVWPVPRLRLRWRGLARRPSGRRP
jgi:cytochrome c biogenesis protein